MDYLPVRTTDAEALAVVLGVDTHTYTHAYTHVAVALDRLLGRRLGSKSFPATDVPATRSSSPGPKASGGWIE